MLFRKSNQRQIYLKSDAEIASMRTAGHILHRVLHKVTGLAEPGISTKDLDLEAQKMIKSLGGKPAFLGIYDFPATICTSINEEVVHGIPSKKRILREGDIVTIDCGVIIDGFYADSAFTVPIGEVDPQTEALLETTRKALYAGIERAECNLRLGEISRAIEKVVHDGGFSVIENYTGHGIGRELHEEPQVYNEYTERGKRIAHGTTIAIEPMVNSGGGATRELEDNWTVVTKNGTYAAHFEHTVAITRDGVEVLTRDPESAFF